MRARVAHLASNHQPFDTRIFLKECRTLAEHGYEVVLVVPHDRDEQRDGVRIRSVPVPASRRERMLLTAYRVYRAALGEDADIYHFHDPELIPYGWLLKLRGKKVVYDVHEDRPRQILSKTWIEPWLRVPVARLTALVDRLSVAMLDRTIVVTPAIQRTLQSSRTTLVQNFPILDELSAPSSVPYADRPPLFAFVGGITGIRGIHEMISAMARLPAASPARLILAGTFDPPELERQVAARPGWERVEARGWQSRAAVAELLGRSRAGLVLYHPEPNHVQAQPNKLFEYMSAGVPVVASDFPLWREIVQGAACGLLVDPLEPEAIAGAIHWLLEHPSEAEAMGRNGAEAVRRRYNWRTESESLLAAYRTLHE